MPIHINEAKQAIRVAGRRGLIKAADDILAESQRRVPEQTGELKRSGGVTPVDDDDVAISYSDEKAVAAHENMTDRYRRGRQPKFLENALNERRNAALKIIAAELRKALD